MTMMLKYSAVAAGLVGGAMLATGAMPASATTLVPANLQVGAETNFEQVRHRWGHRPGRLQGELYWRQKNAPRYGDMDYRFGGPSIGFDLDLPRGQMAFGLNVPRDQRYLAGRSTPQRPFGRITR